MTQRINELYCRGKEKCSCEKYNFKSNRKRKRHFGEGVEVKTVFNAGDSISIFIEKQRLLSNFWTILSMPSRKAQQAISIIWKHLDF